MKRRLLPLLLSLSLLCSLLPAAFAAGKDDPVTALCVVEPGGSALLDVEEFQLLCRQATGHELESVTFSSLPLKIGTITCEGKKADDNTYYMYRSPQLHKTCFTPYSYLSSQFTGQAELAFTLTSEKKDTVPGTLLLRVPEEPDPQPKIIFEDSTTAKAGEPVSLKNLFPFYTTAANETRTELDYDKVISVTFDLPSSNQGTLWLEYGDAAARKLLPGETLFPQEEPSFFWLSFVPAGKEAAEISLHYTVTTETRKAAAGTFTLKFLGNKTPAKPTPEPEPDPVPPNGSSDPRFQDLAGWEWAMSAAEFLGGKGYDADKTSFRPGSYATRMELIHALVLTACPSIKNVPAPAFSDLPADETLAHSAAVAAHLGLVLGDGENHLLPDAQITRQDALVILYRVIGADPLQPPATIQDLSAFSDAWDLAPYAQEAAAELYIKGILQGDDTGRLNPRSPITRAEMASLLCRAFS